ncbi:MAG TPA: hypothetical protein DCS42_06180 [Nitrospiraceae bacterium]|nr:hypothetical protein [Nitrospiraceae bacterium]
MEKHIRGYCSSNECAQLVTYDIDPTLCTMCDKCREACPSFAIEGQKIEPYKTGFTPYRIRQKRCTHCGDCLPVCPEGAIFIVADPGPDADEKKPERHAVGTCPV